MVYREVVNGKASPGEIIHFGFIAKYINVRYIDGSNPLEFSFYNDSGGDPVIAGAVDASGGTNEIQIEMEVNGYSRIAIIGGTGDSVEVRAWQ